MEIKPTGFLSVVASLTPYSDFNQSPRNMYQCQVNARSRNLISGSARVNENIEEARPGLTIIIEE